MNILGITSEMYDDSPNVPVYTSDTRWQAHDCACGTFKLHFENVFDALSTSYAKRQEVEALGQFIQVSPCQTITANLILLDVFKSIKLLILLFQTSKGACSVNTYHELCLQSLNELNKKSNYCNSEIFNRFKQTAEDKTLTMPPSAQVCSQ